MDPVWVPLRPNNNIQQRFQPAFQLEIFDTKANAWKLCHLNEERDCGDINLELESVWKHWYGWWLKSG